MTEIRKIIREMIMSEAYEHADDEIVTFDQIDLVYEFNKLNDLLFNGELQMVPLEWNNTKGKHGMVRYRINPNRTVQKIIGLFLSKYFKIPYRKFKDTLAHEMIHVKNIQDALRTNDIRRKSDAHGYEFIKEMNRINGMGLGYNIDITSSEDFEVSDHVKGKKVYIAIIDIKGSRDGKFLATMTPSSFAEKEKLEYIFNQQIKKGKYRAVDISYYTSSSPLFLKYSLNRNFNTSVSYKVLSSEAEEKVKEVSEYVGEISLGYNKLNLTPPPSSLTQTPPPRPMSIPTSRVEPKIAPRVEPIAPRPEISDEVKEINKKVMAMFKSTTDKIVQEKLFDILKEKDEVKKQIKINSFNQILGPKFGFIL